jgi:excisionase family DNA binding protein
MNAINATGELGGLVHAIAVEVSRLIAPEIARMTPVVIQPALLDVKQAAIYLGRSEQAVQHLIFNKELPVVRVGRRVHMHRSDLDAWIKKNKY